MTPNVLVDTARALVAGVKGLLAMDESGATCARRFRDVGVAATEDTRRSYRDLLVTAAGLSEYVSGVILFDETIRQTTLAGAPFAKALRDGGVIPGIKVDEGAKDFALHPGEKVTEGLDGLRERLIAYRERGARFAKWRAVITPGPGLPTRACIRVNVQALARYAALCQEQDIVPIVEPEVLMDGDHDLAASSAATEASLQALFAELVAQGVMLEGVLLKPNMVLAGLKAAQQPDVDAVAAATLTVLRRCVPPAVAGVAFLSGGQPAVLASERLNAMAVLSKSPGWETPWPVTFSYSRAVQQPALELWRGKAGNVAAAQRALMHRLRCNSAARAGTYSAALEVAA